MPTPSKPKRFHPLWDIFAGLVILAIVAVLILLIIRFDYFKDISFYWIGAPIWFVTGIGVFLGFGFALQNIYQSRYAKDKRWHMLRLLQGFIVAFASIGVGITQLLLARKFEFDSNIGFLRASLPLFISLGIIGILYLIGIIFVQSQGRQRQRQNKKKK